MSSSVGHRRGLDLPLLWLWSTPAAAVSFRPLVWVLPHAGGVAQKTKKNKKKQKKKKKKLNGTQVGDGNTSPHSGVWVNWDCLQIYEFRGYQYRKE